MSCLHSTSLDAARLDGRPSGWFVPADGFDRAVYYTEDRQAAFKGDL